MVNEGSEHELEKLKIKAASCDLCPLSDSRNTVVFGEGDRSATVMFVGEAPGKVEDEQGLPFVGRSGALLDELFSEAGIERSSVFITSIVKCRPPGNRDPRRDEIAACSKWIEEQVRLVQPTLICTLGNFALRLLRQDPAGITSVHGQAEIREVFGRTVRLYPLFHPAAALRSTGTKDLLRADLMRVPGLAKLPLPKPQ